jgi:serine/threonine-protein kinase HipA
MARRLAVYLHGHRIGLLTQNDAGQMVYEYDHRWLLHPNARPLSQSLPLGEAPFPPRECEGYFGGILPEGENREIIARNLQITSKNDVKLLEKIGGECAGAVTFLPLETDAALSGESLPTVSGSYRALSEPELAEILRNLPSRPLLAGVDHIRLSLAGAQDKIAVRVDEGQISLPLDGAPSTHILKPRIKHYDGMVVNEWMCMRLARQTGLNTASVEMGHAEEIEYLLVERYDRDIDRATIHRLHQEDFCQALGISSRNKYQNEGGPSAAMCFDLLRRASSVPAPDVLALFDAVVFNFLIGNNDAHGKNFSLLYRGGDTTPATTALAPLYDLICTVYYSGLSPTMAMKLGKEYDSRNIYPHHFDRLAEEAKLTTRLARRRLQSIASRIQDSLPKVALEHPVGQEIAAIINGRCERILQLLKLPPS